MFTKILAGGLHTEINEKGKQCLDFAKNYLWDWVDCW
jgi:hypothetical protein